MRLMSSSCSSFLEELDKYKLRDYFMYKMELKGFNLLEYCVKKICQANLLFLMF